MKFIKKYLLKTSPILIAALLMLSGGSALAFPVGTIASGGQTPITVPSSLPRTDFNKSSIQTILQIAFGAIGSLALLMIVISGFRYVISDGDPQKMSVAKNGIIYALVGLVVALAAESIVGFIGGMV